MVISITGDHREGVPPPDDCPAIVRFITFHLKENGMTDFKKRRFARRGRPRIARESTDSGTLELQRKRASGSTQEAIDHCLASGMITPEMHQSALHFRWLYTLRFGSPTVKALNPAEYHGVEHRPSSESRQCSGMWDQAREEEYRQAAEALGSSHCLHAVLQITVYNLHPTAEWVNPLRNGLLILTALWRK